MERLGATDDEVQLRSLLVLCAIADGRLADAEAELERMGAFDDGQVFGGFAVRRIGRAELALARGDHAAGLRAYRECAARMRALQFPGIPPTGLEPWVAVRRGDRAGRARPLRRPATTMRTARSSSHACRDRGAAACSTPANPHLDFPVAGHACSSGSAPGACCTTRRRARRAVRLLVLADRFAYNRTVPTMAWERIAPRAGASRPGCSRAASGLRAAAELLGEARGSASVAGSTAYRCRL